MSGGQQALTGTSSWSILPTNRADTPCAIIHTQLQSAFIKGEDYNLLRLTKHSVTHTVPGSFSLHDRRDCVSLCNIVWQPGIHLPNGCCSLDCCKLCLQVAVRHTCCDPCRPANMSGRMVHSDHYKPALPAVQGRSSDPQGCKGQMHQGPTSK